MPSNPPTLGFEISQNTVIAPGQTSKSKRWHIPFRSYKVHGFLIYSVKATRSIHFIFL